MLMSYVLFLVLTKRRAILDIRDHLSCVNNSVMNFAPGRLALIIGSHKVVLDLYFPHFFVIHEDYYFHTSVMVCGTARRYARRAANEQVMKERKIEPSYNVI